MILATGGTGLIGSEVLQLLSQSGVAARAISRNTQNAKQHPGVTWGRRRPHETPDPEGGLRGRKDFIPPDGNPRKHGRHIPQRHRRRAGCRLGAHREGLGVRRIGPLRSAHLLLQADYIKKNGAVYSAAGRRQDPHIDPGDIAAVAAVTLTSPGHLGKKYVVIGSEVLSYREAAGSSAARSAGVS